MDRKILIPVVVCMAMLFSACEKDAEIPLPEDEPKLVVHGYISPQDTAINIRVTSSDPIFDDGEVNLHQPISNATVKITVGGNTYVLTYNSNTGYYYIPTATLAVIPSQTYYLEVSAVNYVTVTSQTTVPQINNFQLSAAYVSTTPPDQEENMPLIQTYQVSWNHFTDNNFYRLVESFYTKDTITIGADTIVQPKEHTTYSGNDASSGIITDELELFTDIYFEPYPYDWGFYLDLIVSTEAYFKYHNTLDNYVGEDPFAEPTQVPSNITNGYGLFAGFIRVTKRID